MKTKRAILFLSGVFLSSGLLQAQENQDCARNASLAYTDAKAQNYEAAYPRIQQLREDCPTYSIVTYQYGERILKDMLSKAAEGQEKTAVVEDLMKLYEERLTHFPDKTDAADVKKDIAQLQYDNKIGSTEEQFQAFNDAYQEAKDGFNAKNLYTYFTLMVDLQDAGERTLEDVFALYDEVTGRIQEQENDMAEGLAVLIEKQEEGAELSAQEERRITAFETNLRAYNQVRGSINGKLGERADCENLIPLYTRDFEARKGDVAWLQSAAGRLSGKDCTEDPIFFQLVEALHQAEPDAKSALYLGQLAEAEGNASTALEYYQESASLEENPADKARVLNRIADNFKDRGSFGQARNFYNQALENQPSLGRAYLKIADMYAQSANNCGETTFEKRSVYWLAAEMAERAGRVDPSIKSTADQTATAYRGRAPQRADIFAEDMQGQNITIGCWIGRSVRVPNL